MVRNRKPQKNLSRDFSKQNQKVPIPWNEVAWLPKYILIKVDRLLI